MPKHYSVATVIDKNRIASTEAYVPMIEIQVIDHHNGNLVETLRICKNGNEDITYLGNLYASTSFTIKMTGEIDRPSEVSLSFFDRTGIVLRYMQMYRGGVGFKVKLFFLNTGNMEQPPEYAEEYSVRTASSDAGNYMVNFTLGMENPLAQRVPRRTQRRDRCQWRYKGPECGYSGSMTSCDFTLQGGNGCAAHQNEPNFGGFPGITAA